MTVKELPATGALTGRLMYPLAAGLVVLYVNTFELWGVLVRTLGADKAALVPVVTLACLLAGGGWRLRQRTRALPLRPALRPILILLALALAVLGLMLTDPAYPAKRIHVPQYLLLALVLRRALSDHAGGLALTIATIVTTLLFGIHDEMLQGLHPDRSYGLRDMLVNGTAGASGAILAAGAGIMPGRSGPFRMAAAVSAALMLLAAAVAVLVVALTRHVDVPPPIWLGLPAAAGGLAVLAARRFDHSGSGAAAHIAGALAWVTLPFALYPVIPHVTPLVFH